MFRSVKDYLARISPRTRRTAVAVVIGLPLVVWSFLAGHVVALVVVSAMAAGGVLLGKRMRTVRKVRLGKIAAARGRTKWPKLLGTTLKPNEKVEYESRMHPVVMFYDRWVAIFAVVFVMSLLVAPFVGVVLLLVTAAALVGFVVSVTPGAIKWWFTRWCFTDRRVIVITGILSKNIDAVMLDKLETVSHKVPFISSVLERFGLPVAWHWKFDTQVQRDPFNELLWAIYPSPVGDILERYVVSQGVTPRP
jgi:hypothetical protein